LDTPSYGARIYHVNKIPPLDPTLSQVNPVQLMIRILSGRRLWHVLRFRSKSAYPGKPKNQN